MTKYSYFQHLCLFSMIEVAWREGGQVGGTVQLTESLLGTFPGFSREWCIETQIPFSSDSIRILKSVIKDQTLYHAQPNDASLILLSRFVLSQVVIGVNKFSTLDESCVSFSSNRLILIMRCFRIRTRVQIIQVISDGGKSKIFLL